ncbi:hypothetical protein EIP91_007077 [Steccherinum ochraceum]|uniref:thioredoxin-dependent peroxiredoxin n=1 Tax=Steccherinum ochraceum TaxID=92696 RepID=A0A4R0R4N9_9APHY|nr:hypothetical protein EIP91_007077 [Steccherinum ochraceum]
MPSCPHPLIGKPAPIFSLPNYNGEMYHFMPGGGTPTALFFYPSSGKFGCTQEACAFRDATAEKGLFKKKVNVIAISANPVAEQRKFVEENKLTYPVLSDAKGEVRKAYHTSKGLLGLTDSRITFVIDARGVVRGTFDSVLKYSAHTSFVESELERLEAEEAWHALPDSPAVSPILSAKPSPFLSLTPPTPKLSLVPKATTTGQSAAVHG